MQGRNLFAWLSTPRVFEGFDFLFAEPDAGWITSYAYAYGDQASTFVVEMPPETYHNLGLAALGAEPALELLESIFGWSLQGAVLQAQVTDDGRIPWANFPTVTCRDWHRDNVVLLGDAAHTTHYSIGFGTKLALEDAIELASAVAGESDLPTALRRYQITRRRAIRTGQRDARNSQRWFEHAARYLRFEGDDFAMLLNRRRAAPIGWLPPQLLVSGRRLIKRK